MDGARATDELVAADRDILQSKGIIFSTLQ